MSEQTDLCDDPVVRLWLRQGSPIGPVSYQTKAYILREYARHYGLRSLIETGSYDGKNLLLLASAFEEIHSIELSQEYFDLCVRKTANCPWIFMWQGDSAEVLPDVLQQVPEPALVYLDAHYMGEGTALGPDYTPIDAELRAISGRVGDVVIVDDVEEFETNPEYPGARWIVEATARYLPKHEVWQTGNEYLLLPPATERTRPGLTARRLS